MLKYIFKFLILIVTLILFIAEVSSTDSDIEENLGNYTKDKLSLKRNEESEPTSSLEKKDRSNDTDTKIVKVESLKIKSVFDNVNEESTNENKKAANENINNKNFWNDSQESEEDTREILKKFEEKNGPLWKIKDEPSKRHEPGFDLTLEEKKKFKIWKGGIIPYYIDVVSFSDKVLRDKIRNYLQMVNSVAGLSFIELPGPPSNDNERWVFFVNRRGLLGCADHTVRRFTSQGVQQVVLGYDCIETRGEMAEAVMSIVGVPAQHNAPDRDKYIQVNEENIMPDKKDLFEKLNDNEWLFHDLDYDYNSITHYDLFKYSVNGRPTIQLKNEFIDVGLAKTLSSNDLLKIQMLYNYVTKKKKLQLSECEKLFKPRSKFERFVPHRIHVTPRKKPSRYLNVPN